MKTKLRKIITWTLIILGGLPILLSGQSKITNPDVWTNRWEKWNYDIWFLTMIGALEVAGVILLFIPKFKHYGIILLTIIMLGAIGTHLLNSESFVRPLVHMAIFIVLFFLGKAAVSERNLK